MPIIKTKGAASSQGFGEFTVTTPPVVNYIEDVFSTYLYTGNGSTQTITNGIDLSTKGGLVWIKGKNIATNNLLFDTNRGVNNYLVSDGTNAQANSGSSLSAFNTTGFQVTNLSNFINESPYNYVSWTFRKQPKFFDIATVTFTSGSDSTIDFSGLGTVGCVIIKKTNGSDNWYVWHHQLGNAYYGLFLNSANAPTNIGTTPVQVSGTTVTMTNSSAGGSYFSSGSYIAYAYAHNAGGFGLTGSDNVISCGSYTGNGSTTGPVVTLGYEPQWILIKKVSGGTGIPSSSWVIFDTMRGIATISSGSNPVLYPNLADAEDGQGAAVFVNVSATGFNMVGPFDLTNASSSDYIYIAIRRGPMKVPTAATTVFVPVTSSATGSVLTSNFPVDMGLIAGRGAVERGINDRLRGFAPADSGTWPWLVTQTTAAETLQTPSFYNANNTSIQTGTYFGSLSVVSYLFGRAPSFFDEVCYTGTGATNIQTHNLGVLPTLIIIKSRSAVSNWVTTFLVGTDGYRFWTGATFTGLNATFAAVLGFTNTTQITSTTFDPQSFVTSVNLNTDTYVAYLFATCPGVSKVGTYTGTGALQTVNCGFTSGARFVLIKRYDSTGDWYTYDSARGISSGNDPYLFLNTNAAETTGTNYVDTDTTGFKVTAAAPAGLNANGGTYIFLAIA